MYDSSPPAFLTCTKPPVIHLDVIKPSLCSAGLDLTSGVHIEDGCSGHIFTMADLDAELLALAGDDESSGDESSPAPPRSPSPQPSPKHPHQHRDNTPIDMHTKRTARRIGNKSRTRKRRSESEEVSTASSQRSPQSASMSESASDIDTPPIEMDDAPLFPYETIYHSAKDKAEIDALPEIRREAILADRAQQIEKRDQDVALRRMVARKQQQEDADATKKRKANAADLEESQRKSSRQRTKLDGSKVGERNSAIENYKRQRAEKGLRDEQRRREAAERSERQGSPRYEYSDADADGESEVEWAESKYKRRTPSPPKDEPIAELADFQRAKVGRDNFAEVCYTPGFENTIKDCYARCCLGPGPVPGVMIYRICSIKGFQKGRPYAMTKSNGRTFAVDTYVVAAHGKEERPWSFLECSMHRFTEDEWRSYRVTMANHELKLPTRKFINAKLSQINALLNHRFTDAEITDKVQRQNVLMDEINKTVEKEKVHEQRRLALQSGDLETVAACEEKLAAIVPTKLAFNTTLVKPTSVYVNKEQERLAELNRRNQRLNAENVRKAQLAEMKARKAAKTSLGVDELFDSDRSRAGTPVNGVGTPRNQGTPRSSTPVSVLRPMMKDKKGIPMIRKAALDDEIIANMDLGIEVDI